MRALKKRFLYFSFTISISAAVSFSSHAQTAAGYGFRTMVDKTRILIGEPFTLTFVTSSGVGEAIPSPPALPGSGHHFELLEGLPPDTLRKEDILEVSYRYRMTSFDSGHWVIPSFRVSIAGSKRVSISDTIWMDVSMPPLTGNDYHDIKDIVEVQPESSRWGRHLIFFSVILLVAVIAGFILYLKKKQVESPRSASGHDPFGQAMHDIDLLLRDLETGDKDAGKVHMALHELFRSYLEKSYGMPAMSASTTDLDHVKGIGGQARDCGTFLAKRSSSRQAVRGCHFRSGGFARGKRLVRSGRNPSYRRCREICEIQAR